MVTNDLIVAIELGSSKIAGAVGRKCADGSLQVLAYANEPVAGFVRRGVVYNIDQTAQCLSNLINCLEPELNNTSIEQVYVGVGGYTLHSEHNTVVRTFEEEIRVTEEIVTDIEECNAIKQYPGHDMLMMVSQEYKIGNNLLHNPVGVNCTQVEGNYLNILARTSVMQNTAKSFEIAKINIADTSIPPLVAANVLLSENERRQGCVLVDFGADTTTLSVYKGGNLRFLTVIPMGGQSITRDLCSLQLDEQEAERIKCEYGLMASGDGEIMFDDNRTIALSKVQEVIEARFEEIILNVYHQIKVSGYTEKQLLAGVVCCGGGINLKGFESVVAKKLQVGKVRLARNTVAKVEWNTMERPADGTQGVLVGLLIDGTDNCCQDGRQMEIQIQPEDYGKAATLDLFTDDGESAQAKRDEELKAQRQQKIKEAEERKAKLQAEKQQNRGNGFFSGFVKKIKSVGDNMEKFASDFLKDEDNNK
jgi:cell division protein FtsA